MPHVVTAQVIKEGLPPETIFNVNIPDCAVESHQGCPGHMSQ